MPIPKGCRWGVDSWNPITKSLFDFVKTKTGDTPDFWGRYIGRQGSQLQRDEVKFLQDNCPSTRLLIAYNPLSLSVTAVEDKPRSNPIKEYDRGLADAGLAIAAAHGLVPAGVCIYANVEPTQGKVSADWVRGWWDGMRLSPYGYGGIYGNTSSTMHTGYLGEAYRAAMEKMPDTFRPPLWAALPGKGKKIPAEINFEYEPGDPPGYKGASVVWQYAVAWYPYDPKDPKSPARFDTNLATIRGYDGMWKVGSSGGARETPLEQHPRDSGAVSSVSDSAESLEYSPR
jgi:hypothetical protein